MNKKHLLFILLYTIIGLVFLIDAVSENIALINYTELHFIYVILFYVGIIMSIFLHLKFYHSDFSTKAEKWFLLLTTSIFSLLLISGAVIEMYPQTGWFDFGGFLVALLIWFISLGLWIITLIVGLTAVLNKPKVSQISK